MNVFGPRLNGVRSIILSFLFERGQDLFYFYNGFIMDGLREIIFFGGLVYIIQMYWSFVLYYEIFVCFSLSRRIQRVVKIQILEYTFRTGVIHKNRYIFKQIHTIIS